MVGDKASNEVYAYRINKNAWEPAAPLKHARAYFVFWLNKLSSYGLRSFAIGGHDGSNFVNCIEVCEFDRERAWKENDSMDKPRSHFACAYAHGRLFIVGGQTATEKSTNTVQSWKVDCTSGMPWRDEASMKHKWENVSFMLKCIYNDMLLYALGGTPKDAAPADTQNLAGEVYTEGGSPSSGKWEDIRSS